ncbi:MAG: hypothetical protein GY807_16515 [Gammaproteobacteria bacterium]|nr:hypothetical protein [Gammaproteobacteria bacterium]
MTIDTVFWRHLTPGRSFISLLLAIVLSNFTLASDFDSSIPMRDRGTSTYYLPCQIEGYGDVEMMFDTGSSYMTINEQMLEILQQKGQAIYVKRLDARMADGSRSIVPVYRLGTVNVGNNCTIHDVEAAVLPGATRNLLGLSALKKAGPFIFYPDPPRLVLSNCSAHAEDSI